MTGFEREQTLLDASFEKPNAPIKGLVVLTAPKIGPGALLLEERRL